MPACGPMRRSGSLVTAHSSPPLSPSSIKLLAVGSPTNWLMPSTPRFKIPSTIWFSVVVCADPTWPVGSYTLPPIAGNRGIRSVPGKPLVPYRWWPTPPLFRSCPMNSRPPFCCSTACWMNSSAVSSLDWNPSSWATAATRSWPSFSAWTRTLLPAVASNCSTGMCRRDALAALAADASLSKKNRRHCRSDRISARLRHCRRSHQRPEVVPSNDGQGCPRARRLRHPRQSQHHRPIAPSDGLFLAGQSQETLHRPLPRS